MQNTTTTQNVSVTFIPRTQFIGWVRVTGRINEDTAIRIANAHAPKRWIADTGAEWSDAYDAWLVPVFLPTR